MGRRWMDQSGHLVAGEIPQDLCIYNQTKDSDCMKMLCGATMYEDVREANNLDYVSWWVVYPTDTCEQMISSTII